MMSGKGYFPLIPLVTVLASVLCDPVSETYHKNKEINHSTK